MKWLVTAFLALVCAVLSFNAFVGNDLSKGKSSNRLIAMLTDSYTWLLTTLGAMPTAILFAICGCAIVVAAIRDGRHRTKVL
jgi:hypothetical protein